MLEKTNLIAGDEIVVLALESNLNVTIDDVKLPYPVKIAGTVDRIEIRNGKVRIVDYKTGRVEKNTLLLKQWDNLAMDLKNDKIIQVLCYALMYSKTVQNSDIEAGILSFKNMKSGFLPFGIKEDKVIVCDITTDILEKFTSEIIKLINEILDSSMNFEEKT